MLIGCDGHYVFQSRYNTALYCATPTPRNRPPRYCELPCAGVVSSSFLPLSFVCLLSAGILCCVALFPSVAKGFGCCTRVRVSDSAAAALAADVTSAHLHNRWLMTCSRCIFHECLAKQRDNVENNILFKTYIH